MNIPWFHSSPYPILSYPILSYPILSYPVLSCSILSYPVLSCPILSYPVLSCPILSCLILSSPLLSSPLLPPFSLLLSSWSSYNFLLCVGLSRFLLHLLKSLFFFFFFFFDANQMMYMNPMNSMGLVVKFPSLYICSFVLNSFASSCTDYFACAELIFWLS